MTATITWTGTVDGHVVTSSGWKVNTTTHIPVPCFEHGAYELLRSRYQHINTYNLI